MDSLSQQISRSEQSKHQQWDRYIRDRGRRYSDCHLSTFLVSCSEQEEATCAIQDYLWNHYTTMDTGAGLILLGPTGTGKDHLLTAAVHMAIAIGCRQDGHEYRWTSGSMLFQRLRDAMKQGRPERSVTADLEAAAVLVISDPLEAGQQPTEYQRTTLYRIIDYRYSRRLPTWLSVNATSKAQMVDMLGAAIVDRLVHDATVIPCSWPSYRRKREVPHD